MQTQFLMHVLNVFGLSQREETFFSVIKLHFYACDPLLLHIFNLTKPFSSKRFIFHHHLVHFVKCLLIGNAWLEISHRLFFTFTRIASCCYCCCVCVCAHCSLWLLHARSEKKAKYEKSMDSTREMDLNFISLSFHLRTFLIINGGFNRRCWLTIQSEACSEALRVKKKINWSPFLSFWLSAIHSHCTS